MNNDINLVQRIAQDKEIVQRCLAPYMFTLLFKSLAAQGLIVREDMNILMERAQGRDMQDLDPLSVLRLGRKIEDQGHAILKVWGGSLKVSIIGLSRMLIKLVDEGFSLTENVLLCALAFSEDYNLDPSEWGKEADVTQAMAMFMNEAHRLGWFLLSDVAPPE